MELLLFHFLELILVTAFVRMFRMFFKEISEGNERYQGYQY